jgi:hypothetical protein
MPSELCLFPSHQMREAERRQALGCIGTRLERASNVGPRVPARISFRNPRSRGTLASRRSTAAIYWPRARLGHSLGRCT